MTIASCHDRMQANPLRQAQIQTEWRRTDYPLSLRAPVARAELRTRLHSEVNLQANVPSLHSAVAQAQSHARSRPLCGSFQAWKLADGKDQLRCPGVRRATSSDSHPIGSEGPQANRGSPHQSIANRREREPGDAQVARTLLRTAERRIGNDVARLSAEVRELEAVRL